MSTKLHINDLYNNLKNFVEKCDTTNIQILYFTPQKGCKENLEPNLLNIIKSVKINNSKYYIKPGNTQGWYYIYLVNNLKLLIELGNDGIEIVGYINEDNFKSDYESVQGGAKTIANIGNHITFGLIRQRDGNILVKSHKTTYDEDIDKPSTFIRNENACNFILKGRISGATQCEYKEFQPPEPITLELVYKSDNAILSKLVDAALNINEGGNKKTMKEYYIYNGHRYIIRTGRNGGKYIQLKTNNNKNKRHYIKNKQRGGADIEFTDGLINFLYTYVFVPVKNINDELEYVELIYDINSELGNNTNTNLVILYHYRDLMQVFYINALKAQEAYKASIALEKTAEQKRCLEEFNAEINNNMIPRVSLLVAPV